MVIRENNQNEVEVIPINVRSSANVTKIYQRLISTEANEEELKLRDEELQKLKNLKAEEVEWLRWMSEKTTQKFLEILETRRNVCLAKVMEKYSATYRQRIQEPLISIGAFEQEAKLLTDIITKVTQGKELE